MTLGEVTQRLAELARAERWRSERVGEPGCMVRLEAAANVKALEAALNLLGPMREERSEAAAQSSPSNRKDGA